MTDFEAELVSICERLALRIYAWCILPNHYHLLLKTERIKDLRGAIGRVHGRVSFEWNGWDNQRGRKVWYNFWDTRLSYERSYLARLNYVHQNPVKHGLVAVANQYRWCSAAWFERTAPPAMVKTIYGFKIDKLKIDDDY